MDLLIEFDLESKRRFNKSPLKYLDSYLMENKRLTESQYTEVLGILVEQLYDEIRRANKSFGDAIEKSYKRINAMDGISKEEKLTKFNQAKAAILQKKATVMKGIRDKYGKMSGSAKAAAGKAAQSKAGQKAAELAARAKATKPGMAFEKLPPAAKKAAAGGAVVAGGLALYSARRRKKEAAKKLGINK